METLPLSLFLLLFVAEARAANTTTATMATGCSDPIFEFKAKSDAFMESCMPVRYEDDRNAFYAVPDECTYYYWRANMFVYKCPTAEGTFFDRATQTFVTFDPNCTCPNSRSTTGTTMASTTTTIEADKVTGGRPNTGAIAGGLVAVLFIAMCLVALAVFLRRRKNNRLTNEKVAETNAYRISSIESDTYDELKEIDPPYDNNTSVVVNRNNLSTLNRGPLPDAPEPQNIGDALKTDDTEAYLQPRQLTGTNSMRDADDVERGATDKVYTKQDGQANGDATKHDSVMPPEGDAPPTPRQSSVAPRHSSVAPGQSSVAVEARDSADPASHVDTK